MKSTRRTFLSSAAGAVALPMLPRAGLAQDAYPSRPIHLIIGFTPGSTADITGRVLANGAAPLIGQQFVIESKPGASGTIAAQYVARAAKDGYTLFLPSVGTLTDQIISPAPSFDMAKDYAPIALLANGPFVLVVNPATKVRSVAELIALAKSGPGEVLYGSPGIGTVPHLISEMFAQRTGVKLIHVPYPGSPQVTNDLIAGRITMAFNSGTAVIGQIEAGDLVALATTAKERPSALPDVPTMAEAGLNDFDAGLWLGLLAPIGTPLPIIDRLASAAGTAMHRPEAVEALRRQGYEPLDGGPEAFAALIRSETARWSEVARSAGLKT